MQRLSQIMARRRQKARFSEVGELELLCALLDLALQRRIRILKSHGHAVELVAQHFEFVPGPDRNALGEVAATDPRRAVAKRLNRHDHSASKEQAREEREHKGCEEQRPGAQN